MSLRISMGAKCTLPRMAMILLMVCWTTSCSDFNFAGSCSRDTVISIANQSGEISSSVVAENCGATSEFVTLVMLQPGAAEKKPSRDDQWIASYSGKPRIELRWLDDGQLLVVTQAYRRSERRNDLDVRVMYQDLGLEGG